jgi:hypothetical protein
MKLTPIAQVIRNTAPRPLEATSSTAASVPVFTAEEARRGYAMRGNTKHYCCYGMYCDAGHTSDCMFATPARTLESKP